MILRAAAAAAVLLAVAPPSEAAGRIVTIGEAFDGGSVSLNAGDELAVDLPAAGGPSWEVAFNEAAVLKPVTPGDGALRFRAVAEGASALGLAATGSGDSAGSPRFFRVQVQVRPEAIRRPFRLEQPDDGSRIFVLQGDVLSVKLPANPTTGYSWGVARNAPAVLRPVGEPRYEGPEKAVPGAGGFQTFEFRVAGPGTAWLQLTYRRPFEKDAAPARTWNLFVAAAEVSSVP